MTYFVIISNSQPTTNTPGVFWVNPLLSELRVRTGNWSLVCNGNNPISSYTSGTFMKSLIIQETTPDGTIGQLWLRDSTQQMYVFLDDWIPY